MKQTTRFFRRSLTYYSYSKEKRRGFHTESWDNRNKTSLNWGVRTHKWHIRWDCANRQKTALYFQAKRWERSLTGGLFFTWKRGMATAYRRLPAFSLGAPNVNLCTQWRTMARISNFRPKIMKRFLRDNTRVKFFVLSVEFDKKHFRLKPWLHWSQKWHWFFFENFRWTLNIRLAKITNLWHDFQFKKNNF